MCQTISEAGWLTWLITTEYLLVRSIFGRPAGSEPMEHDHQHLLHVEGAPHLKIKALLYNLCNE